MTDTTQPPSIETMLIELADLGYLSTTISDQSPNGSDWQAHTQRYEYDGDPVGPGLDGSVIVSHWGHGPYPSAAVAGLVAQCRLSPAPKLVQS